MVGPNSDDLKHVKLKSSTGKLIEKARGYLLISGKGEKITDDKVIEIALQILIRGYKKNGKKN